MPPPPRLLAPPLESAVCELRFPRSAEPLSAAAVGPLQKALAAEYPRFEEQTGVELRLTAEGLKSIEAQVFRFSSPDGNWHVQLTPAFFSLETLAYEDVTHFVQRWRWVADIIAGQLGLQWRERLGTRYVNKLPADPGQDRAGMAGVLREPLLSTIGSHPRTARLISSLHEERFQQDDGVITARHGLQVPPTESGQPPFYLLDFDYYSEAFEKIDLDACEQLITAFNEGVFEFLRGWAVTEEHFATFQPQEAAGG